MKNHLIQGKRNIKNIKQFKKYFELFYMYKIIRPNYLRQKSHTHGS